MMKLIITEHADHCSIDVMDGCLRLHAYTFDNKEQAKAFCSGFLCAKSIANAQVQYLADHYDYIDKRA